jgi:hypothetical protein
LPGGRQRGVKSARAIHGANVKSLKTQEILAASARRPMARRRRTKLLATLQNDH